MRLLLLPHGERRSRTVERFGGRRMHNFLYEPELKKIEARAKAAIQRPIHMTELGEDLYDVWKEADGTDIKVQIAKFYHEDSATFFLEALKDIPDLIAEIRRLRSL